MISCEFKFDTLYAELKFNNGSMIATDTILAKNEVYEICMNGLIMTALSQCAT